MERYCPHRGRYTRNLRGSQLSRLAPPAHQKAALELEYPGIPFEVARQPQRRGVERPGHRKEMSGTNSILPQICADIRRSGVSRQCTRTNTNSLKSFLRWRALALIRGCTSAFLCANLRLVCCFAVLILLLSATGCRSRVIKVSLTNTSEQPLSAIIVDYPNATFGVNTLAP